MILGGRLVTVHDHKHIYRKKLLGCSEFTGGITGDRLGILATPSIRESWGVKGETFLRRHGRERSAFNLFLRKRGKGVFRREAYPRLVPLRGCRKALLANARRRLDVRCARVKRSGKGRRINCYAAGFMWFMKAELIN